MERFIRRSFYCRFTPNFMRWCTLGLLTSAAMANAQEVDWSEKDLARSVHRAEQTFQGGEMSRAYGLFAHLVSVAGDRAFLHYRFGATCTYTSQRLNEAIEHLEIARELGILKTEDAAGWHYYVARYHQALFQFEAASIHLRTAMDLASNKEDWLEDAKLRFGQCTTNEFFPGSVEKLDGIETLVSHSDDYFRLYEMPVSEGRLLTIPEQLRSKEDRRRDYTSQLHWLPGQRMAFYSSYGKDGDTGLDVYRVSVDGAGGYGVPVRLPAPVNSDFDDCAPVCMPGIEGIAADRLFFSSSRPEALGGYDIFQVDGELTAERMELIQAEAALQLPFEINSTADEFLYWENDETGEGWLTTNRNQDFEGREVWRFELSRTPVDPVALSIQTVFGSSDGLLSIRKEGSERHGIEHSVSGESTIDLLLAADEVYQVSWEAKDGTVGTTERLIIGKSNSPSFISEPLRFQGIPSGASLQAQLDEQAKIDQPLIEWTFDGLSNQVYTSMFGEVLNDEAFAAIRAEGIHEVGIEKVLLATNTDPTKGSTIPEWMLEAMHEIGVATALEEQPKPVQNTRGAAVRIQTRMEKIQCWDAPGTEAWKAQTMIERYGEPALALLSEEVRQLRMHAQKEQDRWGTWSDAIAEYVYQTGVDSEDWDVLNAYCEAQFQAYAGAYVHAEDMFRRIDSHLRFERWIANALPMEIAAFREDLGRILTNHPNIANALTAAAQAIDENGNIDAEFENLQTALWSIFTDDIIRYEALGIYSLPEMEQTQAWFLRSGGIVEELQNQLGTQDRLAKGQQAVGLAWETCREGERKRNQVLKESEMSPGAWWESFGPADSEHEQATQAYAGYELFVKHDDPILNQAHAYQQELDILRTSATGGEAYQASLKSAIAMRSSIQREMQALFGGERTTAVVLSEEIPTHEAPDPLHAEPVTESDATTSLVALASSVVDEKLEVVVEVAKEDVPKRTNASVVNAGTMRYTVQIGAFANEPNFQGFPLTEPIFELHSTGKLTKYGCGKFDNYEAAQEHLAGIRSWANDAFIQLITVPSASSGNDDKKPNVKPEASSKPKVKELPKPAPKVGKSKQFRVRIVAFTESLQPAEVATLLRLGNEVSLKTTRQSSETVYFTDTFESLKAAKDALALCIKRGFNDAEIEVLYE